MVEVKPLGRVRSRSWWIRRRSTLSHRRQADSDRFPSQQDHSHVLSLHQHRPKPTTSSLSSPPITTSHHGVFFSLIPITYYHHDVTSSFNVSSSHDRRGTACFTLRFQVAVVIDRSPDRSSTQKTTNLTPKIKGRNAIHSHSQPIKKRPSNNRRKTGATLGETQLRLPNQTPTHPPPHK
jgi:hypothetical protein